MLLVNETSELYRGVVGVREAELIRVQSESNWRLMLRNESRRIRVQGD